MSNVIRFAWLVCVLLPPHAVFADTRTLSGDVLDEVTGRPVEGARVDVVNHALSTLTDARGHFLLEGLPSTAAAVRATADGYDQAVLNLGHPDRASAVEIRLRPQLRFDDAVVVAAHREEADRTSVPRAVSVLTTAEIARTLPRTTPEAIMNLAGVLVQKTNHGGGSPYLRGLVGNHVLVLVDGVRLNNSTFRYGPNQYLATIDPGQIERLEVLRGPGSVLFGSDAIGGVINIVTKRPALASHAWRVSGGTSGKVVSSGLERGGRLDLMASGPRAGLLAGLSFRDYGHLRAGGNLGVEAPSGYSEVSGDARALIRVSSTDSLELAFQQVYQHDVPRFDQVSQRGFSRYSFDPQIRRLGYARWQRSGGNRWMQTATASVSYHQSVERRERQQRGSATQVVEQDEVAVGGISVEVRSAPAPFWSVVSGIDYTHDRVGSWRRDTHLVSGAQVAGRGLYPDGARAGSGAIFAHSSLRFGRTILDGGLRFSQYSVSAADPVFGSLDIKPRGWVSSVAAMHTLGHGSSIVASISQAFRAPNIDDVSTLGAFDFGVEVPSTDLAPETAVAYEAGIRLDRPDITGSVVAYRTNLADLIERVRSSFNGQDLLEGQRVYRRANVGRAYVYGMETEARLNLTDRIGVFGNLTYTFGQQVTADQPMRRIPPLNGLVGARLVVSPRRWLEASVRAAAKQDRLAPGDRDDHRIQRGGTPGWVVVSASVGFPVHQQIDLVAGIHNLFDRAYRIHGSGIDEYGRAAWLGAHIRF